MSRDDLGALGLTRDVEKKLREAILALAERETDAYIEQRQAPEGALREAARERVLELSQSVFSLRFALAVYVVSGELYLTDEDRQALRTAKAPRKRRPAKAEAARAPQNAQRPRKAVRTSVSAPAPAPALPGRVDLGDGTQLLLGPPTPGPAPSPAPQSDRKIGAGAAVGMLAGAFLGALFDGTGKQEPSRATPRRLK